MMGSTIAYIKDMSKQSGEKQVVSTETEGNKKLSCLTKVRCFRRYDEAHVSWSPG